MTHCTCSIIPADVLRRLAGDPDFSDTAHRSLVDTARLDTELRRLREQARELTGVMKEMAPALAPIAAAPAITVYDCKHSQVLPGSPIANPGASTDPSVLQCFTETQGVAAFYAQVFHRNSIDGGGMTMMSSVHFGSGYNNAMWNGHQMIYGDGDGSIFVDFTRGNDVIAHELTHGVTQYTLRLAYANEPGGLNESMSDVFGSMFRQWRAGQTVTTADWLIGSDIMGPAARARGLTCLRDMANPGAPHCLAPQPSQYSQYHPGMDPHYSSGIPNSAFYKAAMAIGGRSWERTGQIWYRALTGSGPNPNMTMSNFAHQTRAAAAQLYPGDAAIAKAVDTAWKQVGVP